jgi:hypothetical protein
MVLQQLTDHTKLLQALMSEINTIKQQIAITDIVSKNWRDQADRSIQELKDDVEFILEDEGGINQRLKSIVTDPKSSLLNPSLNLNDQFPFYYRPSKRLRDLTTKFTGTGDLISAGNMAYLQTLVKISSTDLTPGYSLVLNAKLSPELPYSIRKDVSVPSKAEMVNISVGLMGANQLFLLSHDSIIPGKGKIDIPNTIYGIDQDLISNEIEPKTSSMVRGEELLELLNLMVRFCLTHVHPYPLMPPSSVTLDGLSTDDLLAKMQEAYQKVLNSNIRIN